MTSITASGLLLTELGPLKQVTEIRAPEGVPLGYSALVTSHEDSLYQEAARQIDPAKVQRRKQSREHGFTIDDVLSHLRSLETGACPGP